MEFPRAPYLWWWESFMNASIPGTWLFTVARWLERDSVDIARFPKIHEHHQRMAESPAVKKALAEQLRT